MLKQKQHEYAFGCTLFDGEPVAYFEVGPVKFEPRKIWLERKSTDGRWASVAPDTRVEQFDQQIADGPISDTMRQAILARWDHPEPNDLSSATERQDVELIVRTVGKCPYVCSVSIPRFSTEAGQNIALLAARLALAGLSLVFHQPSEVLRGFNLLFDREVRSQHFLSFTPSGVIGGASIKSIKPFGATLDDSDWKSRLNSNKDHFDTVAAVLKHIVCPGIPPAQGELKNPSRAKVWDTLYRALLWFHEACRETSDLVAVVKYAAALDALTCGGKSNGITKLIEARLNLSAAAPIEPNGITVGKAVNEIYTVGRSHTLHGTNNRISEDWSEIKRIAEGLAVRCLQECFKFIAQNPDMTDPKTLQE